MKRIYLILFAAAALMASCEKATENEVAQQDTQEQTIPENDLKVFKQMGYDTRSIQTTEDGYLIDGTTLMTRAQLEEARASYIWFQIQTDITDPWLVDLNITHQLAVQLEAGQAWLTHEGVATLYNETTQKFVPLKYLGGGKWSFNLTESGVYLAQITVKDRHHEASTVEKHIIVQPGCQPFFYKTERTVLESSKERITISFFSEPTLTNKLASKYNIECTYTVKKVKIYPDRIEEEASSQSTVIIKAGTQSYTLYEGHYISLLMDFDYQTQVTIDSIKYLY